MNTKKLSQEIEIDSLLEEILPKIKKEDIKILHILFPEFNKLVTRKDIYFSSPLGWLIGFCLILAIVALTIQFVCSKFKQAEFDQNVWIVTIPFIVVFGTSEISFFVESIQRFFFKKDRIIIKFIIHLDFLDCLEKIARLFKIKNLVIYSYMDNKYLSIIKNYQKNEKIFEWLYDYQENYKKTFHVLDQELGIILKCKISENKEVIKEILNILKENDEYSVEKDEVKSYRYGANW